MVAFLGVRQGDVGVRRDNWEQWKGSPSHGYGFSGSENTELYIMKEAVEVSNYDDSLFAEGNLPVSGRRVQ